MARTIAQIKAQIIAEKNNQAALAGLTSTSSTAIYNLWAFIQAVCINLFEQLIDVKIEEIETTVYTAIVPSDQWVRQKALEFQYDATTPQVLQLVNFVPSYPVVNPDLRIITRASVKTQGSKIVLVKVAKNEPPEALSAPELSAFQDYLSQGGSPTDPAIGFGFAGVQMTARSTAPDKLYLAGTIYYSGRYSAVIQANVVSALEDYMSNLPFDGNISVLGITDKIQSVVGVVDMLFTDIAMRADAVAFGSKTYLIQSSTQTLTSLPTYAGYVVEEDTASQGFLDKLVFVAI